MNFVDYLLGEGRSKLTKEEELELLVAEYRKRKKEIGRVRSQLAQLRVLYFDSRTKTNKDDLDSKKRRYVKLKQKVVFLRDEILKLDPLFFGDDEY